MPNYHPLLVHFPIALLSAALVFELLALLLSKDSFVKTGWLLQVAGTIGLVAAVVTGLQASSQFDLSGTAKEYLEMHEQIAFVVSALFAILLLWRIAERGNVPVRGRYWFYGLFIVGVATMWTGAWYGGLLVYYFGVGVSFGQ